ncbi:uncharacterized protein BDZ83DRAFT_422753 [Colletotrichum acutatum]|uniref:Uncharacterized protein n=1 Tax=Glomerella acutata TaxID=27357 RepID=A0AAD8XMH2_GLOAC|nr:uncharacterized protein BDZ83DRAFT_422753 [Colletotrichum acutatum]KAK1730081.1 hypothetical protein BDZ83DRAFT_422753 [Colletotrichum acutatum]
MQAPRQTQLAYPYSSTPFLASPFPIHATSLGNQSAKAAPSVLKSIAIPLLFFGLPPVAVVVSPVISISCFWHLYRIRFSWLGILPLRICIYELSPAFLTQRSQRHIARRTPPQRHRSGTPKTE